MRRLGLVIVVCHLLLGITITRVSRWQDARALWAEAAAQNPALPRPWLQLGALDAREGRTLDAAEAFSHAIRAASASDRSPIEQVVIRASAELNLGILAAARGDWPTAEIWRYVALEHAPGNRRLQEVAAWLDRP